MRAWLPALLLVTLAGCALPEEPTSPLLGVCPQWEPGPWTVATQVSLNGTDTRFDATFTPNQNGSSVLTWQGHPLDRFTIRFNGLDVQDGVLKMRAYNEAGQLRSFQDYRDPAAPRSVPVLSLGETTDLIAQEFDVYLSPVSHGSEPAPGPLRIEWTFEPLQEGAGSAVAKYVVTAGYRVCGAVIAA